jgi:hypothetical protein
MPTKRRRVGAKRLRHADAVPVAVQWWLEHGRTIGILEARMLDLGDAAAWEVSCLHFARRTVSGWTRADLRALGFGPRIDAHISAAACPPDRWQG